MNKAFIVLMASLILLSLFAQKDFEGIMVYTNTISSKVDGISNTPWKKILVSPDVDASIIYS